MSEELKPCPFCGGEAELLYVLPDRPSAFVHCVECHVHHAVHATDAEAIAAWNTRKERPNDME